MIRFVSPKLATWLCMVGAALAGCSLQEFDYLQNGSPSAGSGGAAATSGSGSGGTTLAGDGGAGMPAAAGSAGTTNEGGRAGDGTGPTGGAGEGGAGGAGPDPGGGTGAVGELVNPSFETASIVGWTVQPASAVAKKYIFVQWPVGSATVPDGNYELSTWHETEAYALEVYQTVKGLDDGTYTFKGYFTHGPNFNQISMFARNCGDVDPEPVPIVLTSPTSWEAFSFEGIEVTGGSCEIGLSVDAQGNSWLNADLFSFTRQPAADSE